MPLPMVVIIAPPIVAPVNHPSAKERLKAEGETLQPSLDRRSVIGTKLRKADIDALFAAVAHHDNGGVGAGEQLRDGIAELIAIFHSRTVDPNDDVALLQPRPLSRAAGFYRRHERATDLFQAELAGCFRSDRLDRDAEHSATH